MLNAAIKDTSMRLSHMSSAAAVGFALSALAVLPAFAAGNGNDGSSSVGGSPAFHHAQVAKTELIDYTPDRTGPEPTRADLLKLARTFKSGDISVNK